MNNPSNHYKTIIGLEIHCQINSPHKLFSLAPNSSDLDKNPNSQITQLEMGTPGILPILNKDPITQAIKAGLAFNGTVNTMSYFDRKHYFYADLPTGFQITQFYKPIIQNGYLDITTSQGTKRITIKQMHLESDAGKNIHESHYSLLDYNRVSVGLIESVTNPDMNSPEEAATFVKDFQNIMDYIGVCHGDMEKGEFRIDVNISVIDLQQNKQSNRVEIKNLNSVHNMEKAIEYEVQVHIKSLQNNEIIPQCTKFFDANKGKTGLLRIKESANDYRYIRENDLPPLILTDDMMDEANNFMKNIILPQEIKKTLMEKGLSLKQAEDIIKDKNQWYYFESLMDKAMSINKLNKEFIVKLYNLLTMDMANIYNKTKIFPWDSCITLDNIMDLMEALEKKIITMVSYKELLEILWHNKSSVQNLIKENNMMIVQDTSIIQSAVDEAIKNNPQEVERYKNGETKLLQFFVGQIMKITKGKADHSQILEQLNKSL